VPRDTKIKVGSKIPIDLADRWELIVREAAKRLFEKRKKIKQAIGPRPYRGLPVSETELLGRYRQIRNDPAAFTNVLAENIKIAKDGRTLLPKDLVSKLVNLETKIREGGY